MVKERLKDYRRLNLHTQNYFRGNTAARRQRIRALQKRIFIKRWRRSMPIFFDMLKEEARTW